MDLSSILIIRFDFVPKRLYDKLCIFILNVHNLENEGIVFYLIASDCSDKPQDIEEDVDDVQV